MIRLSTCAVKAIVHTPHRRIVRFSVRHGPLLLLEVSSWRNKMADPPGRLANLLLRFIPLARRVAPGAGPRRFAKLDQPETCSPDARIWVQDPAWPLRRPLVCLNPRTGQDVQKGIGEPQVQKALVTICARNGVL